MPPVVAEVVPDTFAVVEAGDRTLRLRFNERISERPDRGSLADAVTVSPRTGDVRVSHHRFGLDIELDGGLQPDLVYRVAVSPTLNDMFGNRMAVPFEWIFTTGGEVRPNAVVGQVWDATSGAPIEGALIEARRAAGIEASTDTFPYVASTDAAGIFAVRYLPDGAIDVRVWQDINGNGEVELLEPVWRQQIRVGFADTLIIAHAPLLAGDSTVASAVSAEVLDSLTVRVNFDDFLDPTAPSEGIRAVVTPALDSVGEPLQPAEETPIPEVARVFHEAEFAAWADSTEDALRDDAAPEPDVVETPPGDSVVPDSLPPDSASAEPAGVTDDRPEVRRSPTGFVITGALDLLPNGLPVPQRSIVVRLATPLARGIAFEVTVSQVTNLAQRAGGGGVARIELEPIDPAEGGVVPSG